MLPSNSQQALMPVLCLLLLQGPETAPAGQCSASLVQLNIRLDESPSLWACLGSSTPFESL